jgi:hypothetical protein
MTVSRVSALGLVLTGFGLCTIGAAALNAPHTLHHAKAPERHLVEPHRAAGHSAAAHVAAPATRSAARSGSHAKAQAASSRNEPKLTARGKGRASLRRAALVARRPRFSERFTASSFASGNIFAGDVTGGEDPVVRQAAIDALDGMNGTAVVINPANGRILAMVNQKLALSPGAEPCSTIKITVAMAAHF